MTTDTRHRSTTRPSRAHDPAFQAFTLLRTAFTLAAVVFGLDKYFDVLTDWQQYLAPTFDDIVPGTAHQAMLAVGVVEIAAGVLVALRPHVGGYVVAAWLAGIIAEPAADPRLLRRRAARLRSVRGRARAGPAGRCVPPGLLLRRRAGVEGMTVSAHSVATPAPLTGTQPHRGRLRVLHETGAVDLVAAEAQPPRSWPRSGFLWTAKRSRDPGADGPGVRRDVPAAPLRPDHVPQRRGLRRAGASRSPSRCTRCASTTCCRSSGSLTSATSPASGSSACPSWRGSSSCSPAARRCRSG